MKSTNPDWLALINRVKQASIGTPFRELVELAELDPSEDFRFQDLSGVSFNNCDVRDFDFTGAKLLNCDFRGALIDGADFTHAEIDHAVSGPMDTRRTYLRKARDKTAAFSFREAARPIVSDAHLQVGSVFIEELFTPEMVVVQSRRKAKPVAVSRFFVSEYEWRIFAEGYNMNSAVPLWERGNWGGRMDYPVVNVSWFDVSHYVAWLSKISRKRYRLMDDAEWDEFCGEEREAEYPKAAWYRQQEERVLKEVPREMSKFSANAFGIVQPLSYIRSWIEDGLAGSEDIKRVRGRSLFVQKFAQDGEMDDVLRADQRRRDVGFRIVRELSYDVQ